MHAVGVKSGFTPPAPGKCGAPKPPGPSPPRSPDDNGVGVVVQVSSAAENGSRLCSLVVAGVRHGRPFPVLADESAIAVRVLVDRSIAEFFFAGGRAVYTARSYPAPGADGVELFVPSGAGAGAPEVKSRDVLVARAVAWEMGCGWED